MKQNKIKTKTLVLTTWKSNAILYASIHFKTLQAVHIFQAVYIVKCVQFQSKHNGTRATNGRRKKKWEEMPEVEGKWWTTYTCILVAPREADNTAHSYVWPLGYYCHQILTEKKKKIV